MATQSVTAAIRNDVTSLYQCQRAIRTTLRPANNFIVTKAKVQYDRCQCQRATRKYPARSTRREETAEEDGV